MNKQINKNSLYKNNIENLKKQIAELEKTNKKLQEEIEDIREIELSLKIKDQARSCSISAIALVDSESNLTFVNKAFLNMWGYNNEKEILGKSAVELFQRGKEYKRVIKALSKRENRIDEMIARRKDGSVFYIQCSAIIDISERKNIEKLLRESEERYRNPVEFSPAGIFINVDKKVVFSNSTFEAGGAVIVIKDETERVMTERNLQERGQYHNIIGKSKKMEELYSLLEKLATVPSTVIITGESGTGKELIADALHHKGNRKNHPLMKVNCAALPENLLESELFGHVKGSFTGAIKDKKGWFEKADKGTIFLDEISDITPALQLRLLRVIQEKEIVPVGSTETIHVDVRVIVSTNQDIEKKVREGTFREDLYYRLRVMEVKLVPLRERRDDINLLVEHFIKKFNREFNKNITGISQDVQKKFMTHHWPGNIRELEHTIEHAFILTDKSVITMESLPDEFKNLPLTQTQNICRTNDTAIAIIEALKRTGWKKAQAARILNIDRKTIYRKMKEYNIPLKKTDIVSDAA